MPTKNQNKPKKTYQNKDRHRKQTGGKMHSRRLVFRQFAAAALTIACAFIDLRKGSFSHKKKMYARLLQLYDKSRVMEDAPERGFATCYPDTQVTHVFSGHILKQDPSRHSSSLVFSSGGKQAPCVNYKHCPCFCLSFCASVLCIWQKVMPDFVWERKWKKAQLDKAASRGKQWDFKHQWYSYNHWMTLFCRKRNAKSALNSSV